MLAIRLMFISAYASCTVLAVAIPIIHIASWFLIPTASIAFLGMLYHHWLVFETKQDRSEDWIPEAMLEMSAFPPRIVEWSIVCVWYALYLRL